MFQVAPRLEWTKRPVEWTFDDGEYSGLYLDNFGDEQDLFGVPNKWIGVSRSDGSTPSLVSVKANTDPTSRFSFQRRGRWITKVTTDVEATSQGILDAITQRNLSDATSVGRIFTIAHPWLPLDLEDVVVFRNSESKISSRCRITKQSEDLSLPGALVVTTMHEVAPA